MQELFTMQNLGALFMLIMLQAVLGFDNLLYISLESKKAPKEDQNKVRKLGIGLAVILRIGLLFLLVTVIDAFQTSIWSPRMGDIVTSELHGETSSVNGYLFANFNLHSLIVLGGGMFIIWTAIKEIWHMISQENIGGSDSAEGSKSSKSVIALIVMMNLIFSFDSILSAMALTSGLDTPGAPYIEITLMIIAIVVSGVLMILLANTVSEFLRKNRMFEVLGLFVLLIVGVMLVTEGGHLADLSILGNPIVPMSKTTFYFVIIVLVLVDVIQSKYQKKIIARETAEEVKELKND